MWKSGELRKTTWWMSLERRWKTKPPPTPVLHINWKSVSFLKKCIIEKFQCCFFILLHCLRAFAVNLDPGCLKHTSLSQGCTLHTLRHSLPSWTRANALHLFPKSIQRRNERANKINPHVTQELNIHSLYYLAFSFFAIHKKPAREPEVSSLLMLSEGCIPPSVIPQKLPLSVVPGSQPLCLLSCHTSCSGLSMIISPCSAPDNTMHSLFSFLSLFADVAIHKKL